MKNRKILFLTISLLIFSQLNILAKEGSKNKLLFEFIMNTENYIEGFKSNIGGGAFTYMSLRNDVSKSLLVRCTDGTSPVEWKTDVVPTNQNSDGAGFIWMAAQGTFNSSGEFDFIVNGTKRFTIPAGKSGGWQLKGEDGSRLSFVEVEEDQHGDSHGYMKLWIPKQWVKKGEAQNIKILGNAARLASWIIIYQANDVISYLQNSMKLNNWAEITVNKQILT